MLLATHIIFALSSVVFVSYTALFPSRIKLWVTFFLTLATTLSGTVMLFIHPAHLGKACTFGVLYLGFMFAISKIAGKRLAVISRER